MENVIKMLEKELEGKKLGLKALIKIINDSKIKPLLDNEFKDKKVVVSSDLYKLSNNSNVIKVLETYLNENDIELVDDSVNLSTVSTQLNDYMRSIRKYRLLTDEEIKEAFKKYNDSGNTDIKTRNYIMEHNLRLVVPIAMHYKMDNIDTMDLIEEGNIGLARSIDKFDITLGYKFSTYATWWIKQAISREGNIQKDLIVKPAHFMEAINRVRKFNKEYSNEFGEDFKYTEENIPKMAKKFNITVETLKNILELKTQVSLASKINDEDADSTLEDLIKDERINLEENVVENMYNKEVHDAIETSSLTKKEKEILYRRYGLNGNDEETLEEISKDYNVTRERIRQIELQALRKLSRNPNIKNLYEASFNEKPVLKKVLGKRY